MPTRTFLLFLLPILGGCCQPRCTRVRYEVAPVIAYGHATPARPVEAQPAPVRRIVGTPTPDTPTFSLQYQGAIVVRPRTYAVVDLFDVSDEDLAKLHAAGVKTIAYFSSQYEEWRPDMKDVPFGKPLGDWKGENYLDPTAERTREIMTARIAKAKARGFHAVDVDNVDFQGRDTGFESSKATAIGFVRFLAETAHAHGLKFSLKNAIELIPDVKDVVDMYQNESCHKYSECGAYDGLSPVFNIEYERPEKLHVRPGFYTILKHQQKMDAWEEVLTK